MANWSDVVKSALDTTPNLIYRYRVIREPIVQNTYDRLYVKHSPPNGLSTNRFPHYTKPGIHNYIYWSDDWNLPETALYRFFPENVDLVSYINPPQIRSMAHKAHRNIYIRGSYGPGIPKLEHIFDPKQPPLYNFDYIYWTPKKLNNLWRSTVFDYWRPYRSNNLDHLAVLLYYGGIISSIPIEDDVFYDGNIIMNNNAIIGATTFDPLVFDYLQYRTRQTDPYRMNPDYDFMDQLSPWERRRIQIIY
jgi:hypothetical protein